MKRYEFQSELTSDEVWYRLNALLEQFSSWGPERYDIQGELTEWGCYLWLTSSAGKHRTHLPLHLRTETAEQGCTICCRFLPRRRTLRGFLLGIAALGINAFLVVLNDAEPLLICLWAGVYTACLLGLLGTLTCWVFPGLLSRRYERILLDWVQAHLLTRKLDGIVLPELDVQKVHWAGFVNEEKLPLTYVFRSALPPETLPAEMEQWLLQLNSREKAFAKTRAKWQGDRLTISRTEFEETTGASAQFGGGSVGAFAGVGKAWLAVWPFRATVEPDGTGSILRGKFALNASIGILHFLREHFDEIEEI